MNNEELKDAVNNLPKFVMRDMGVKDNGIYTDAPKCKAVTETSQTNVIATVSDHYKLVQFSDVFLPMIEKIDNAEGSVVYYNGRANVIAYPSGQDTGVLMENSVNKTTSVRIRFVKNVNGTTYVIPRAGILNKMHMGNNIITNVENFSELLEKVKEEWNTIVDKFTQTAITQEEADGITKEFCIGKAFIEKCNVPATNLWDIYKVLVNGLDAIKFRSEIAKMEAIKYIAEMLRKRAFLEKI